MKSPEKLLMTVITFSLVLSAQMMINIPDADVPDIKDVAIVFPNYI